MNSRERSFFDKSRVDALVLNNDEQSNANFYYFSKLAFDNTTLVVRRDGKHRLLVNRINEREAKGKSPFQLLIWRSGQEFWKKFGQALDGCKSVGIDASSVSLKSHGVLKKKIRKRFVDVSSILLEQRAKKEQNEISLIRMSAQIARKIVSGISLKIGKTESDIARELKKGALEEGVGLSFEPIVLFGANTSLPHGKPSLKKLSRGDVVLIDFGVIYKGYCSDTTRCFFIGECKKERKNYQKLQEIFKQLLGEMKPGVSCKNIQRKANELMVQEGFGEMIHSPGHGVGLEVHEMPSLSKRAKGKLSEGMVLAIEPAFYKEYGLRYEDDVVIGRRGATVL
jgi:Xaa-Pro aminopeptidase